MGKTLANIKRERDIGPLLVVAAGLILLVVKLALCSGQRLYLWPEGAELDDGLAWRTATSITSGNWLGAYDELTLSKHSFFSLWLAGLHALGIPYLLGTHLLWAGASLAGAWALAPALKKRWAALLLYAGLLLCPSAVANPAPYGYMMRVYRDSIFPALCLLAVAGMVGYALRYGQPLRKSLGWLFVAGLGLAAAWLTREDGWWLLPFMLAAAGATAVFVLRDKAKPKGRRALRLCVLALPFVLLGGGVLGWCAANNAHYGRFILSDFSSGEFADAYGAMTRVEPAQWEPKTAVPRDVRQKLYTHIPRFAELASLLESDFYLESYGVEGEYQSGGFYWALRAAAAERGHYDTPEASREYFTALAADINALCDKGVFAASGRRSSVSPPIKAAYVGPVLGEGLYSLWFCATCAQCEATPIYTLGGSDPAYYEQYIRPMEEYLGGRAQTATLENSTEPYLDPFQRIGFGVLEGIRRLYALLLPLALVAALCWQVAGGVLFVRRLKAKKRAPFESLVWLCGLGLLGCILLRAFMVAFVTVSSFNIGTFVMYLAPIHPLMVMYGALGLVFWAGRLAGRRRQMREARAAKGGG